MPGNTADALRLDGKILAPTAVDLDINESWNEDTRTLESGLPVSLPLDFTDIPILNVKSSFLDCPILLEQWT
jgi:hypothetical protein